MHIVRRLLHVLLVMAIVAVGAAAAAIIVSQTAWFKNWLRGVVVREASQYLNGQLSIQRLDGNLFSGVELENVGLSLDGRPVVTVADLGLDYNLYTLITDRLAIDEVRLNRPVVHLKREGDSWSLTRLIKSDGHEADREGPQYPFAVDAIGISDATVVIDDPVGTTGVILPERIERLDARLSFEYEPERFSLGIDHVSLRAEKPAVGVNALSGRISVRDNTLYVDKMAMRAEETSLLVDGAIQDYLSSPRLNLRVSSDKTSFAELSKLVPALAGSSIQTAFELKLDGPLDALHVESNVRSSAGQAIARFVADTTAPGQSIRGELSVSRLDLEAVIPGWNYATDVTGRAQVDASATDFTNLESIKAFVRVDAPSVMAAGYRAAGLAANARVTGRRVNLTGRASAYGARVSVDGRVVVATSGEPLRYDFRGRAVDIDVRRLPHELDLPPVETHLSGAFHAKGAEFSGRPKSRQLAGGVTFDESSAAGAHIRRGSTAALSIERGQTTYRTDAVVEALDLQHVGEVLSLPALAVERYRTRLNGHVVAEGRGTTLEEVSVVARGVATGSEIFGGRVESLTFDAAFEADRLNVTARGDFSTLDPAVISGKADAHGALTGTLDGHASLTGVSTGVTLDNAEVTARVTLGSSNVGELAIEHADLDADYNSRTGQIRQLVVEGRDVHLQAKGLLALDDRGNSNLEFVADTPSLQTIGAIVDIPVAGTARIDGTITGNRSALHASGKLTGSDVSYGDTSALTLSGDYTASIPDLDFDRLNATADTSATFVTVAGQTVDEVKGKAEYDQRQVAFDLTARQPERSLTAAGIASFEPEQQQVRLRAFGLDAEGVSWQLAPDTEATIRYGAGYVSADRVALTSGEQSIEASGTLGTREEALTLAFTGIDLGTVDALLLREPQLAGRLSGSARLHGSLTAPDVTGEFHVEQGGFRNFRYDTLQGTVSFDAARLTFDTRLQQNAAQWFTAKGSAPVALFTRSYERVGADDSVDIAVDSSPIDLGLVQGVTTMLTDVKGTVEAHLRVGGTARLPQPQGTIIVADGSLKVAATGTTYSNIAGRVAFENERVHIDQITLLDNHQSALTLTGDLSIDRSRLSDVQIYVTADDFKIIDNDLGNVRIETRLELGGDLLAPKVEGYLGVTTGQANLDEIMALTGSSLYATTPAGETPAAPQTATPASAFANLQADVLVSIPNDLVVKAASLQAPGAAIGLGSLTVTLGGDLRARKAQGDVLRLTGTVNTIRGTYDFQGRRFEIMRDGTVQFVGLDELNPTLDLRTRRVIQGVEAQVNVRGTLRAPAIELRSVPPLEEADILSLIVFNRPVNELGQGDQISLAQRAEGMAAGAVAGQLASSLGRALNLDTFEIDFAPESGGSPEITLGQQVGRNLYVKIQQSLGDQGTTNFVLEYELSRWLRLQSNVMQGESAQQSQFRRVQGSGADLIFFFSY